MTGLLQETPSCTRIVDRFAYIPEEDDILHEPEGDLLLLLLLLCIAPPPIMFNLNLGKEFENQ